MTNYRRGADFERRTAARLRDAGYLVVRSAGSLTNVDLVALRADHTLLVQCKRNGALPPAPWNALYDAALTVGAVPVLAEQLQPRGHAWWRLVGRKDGRGGKQPKEPYEIREVLT